MNAFSAAFEPVARTSDSAYCAALSDVSTTVRRFVAAVFVNASVSTAPSSLTSNGTATV